MRLALLALVMMASLAFAEKHTHDAGKVEIDIPGTWKIDKRNALLVGESKDKAVGLLFWVVEKGDVKEAIKLLDKELEGKITDVKWPKKPRNTTHNGLKGIKNTGTAKTNGKDVYVMLAVLGPTPSKKGVIVLGVIDQTKVTEHKAELENIFASLKPVK